MTERDFIRGLFAACATLVALGAPAHAAAQDEQACAATLSWEGDDGDIAELRSLLEPSLHRIPAESCVGTTVFIVAESSGWHFGLRRAAGPGVAHRNRELGVAATWVESWLAPAIAVPRSPAPPAEKPPDAALVAAPPGVEAVEKPPEPEPENKAEQAKTPHAKPTAVASTMSKKIEPARDAVSAGVPIAVGLRGGGDFDAIGPWGVAELEARMALTSRVWVGLAGSGMYAPQAEMDRRGFALRAVGGVDFGGTAARVRPGIGVGLMSAQGIESDHAEDGASVFAEALTELDLRLVGRLDLVAGASLRRTFAESDSDELESPVAPWIVTTRLGVAWRFGGRGE
jgi:hypothetical protein